MKLNSTKLELRILGMLMLLLPLSVMAQSVPNAYLCGSGTAKLTPTFTDYTPVAGDKIVWTVNGTAESAITYATAADAVYNVAATLAAGNYKYSVQVIPADANLCPSSASDAMVIEKLPAPAIAVNAPGSIYCTDQAAGTVLTASSTISIPGYSLPAGVSMQYVWTATKGGVAVATISDLGTTSTSGDTFTLKAGLVADEYIFTATGSYSTGGVEILPTPACSATANKTIKITVKPGKATIQITS